MGRRLVPITMVVALIAFVVAVLAAGLSPSRPGWWQGAVSLAVLGAITPMIYAVNIRIVPVFSRRAWPGLGLLRLQVALAIAGAWVVFSGHIADRDGVVTAGSVLALAGGLLFMTNIARLFRRPVAPQPAPPLPFPAQAAVDKVATGFTRMAGLYLLVGLAVGLFMSAWPPESGRWELVWAHAMLVGFVISMASGVTYHVLPRWTTVRWRSVTSIRLHFLVTVVALPLMLVALATDRQFLFHLAGPLQAAAVALWIGNCLPFLRALPRLTRECFGAAFALLAIGIALGMSFAVDPAHGARLRLVHAELNLFGWAGLLICGAGYYLIPRFAGAPLRWPRLAPVQLATLVIGLVLSVVTLWLRSRGDDLTSLLLAAHILMAAGLGLFALIAAGTYRASRPAPAAAIQFTSPTLRSRSSPAPRRH